MEIRINDLVAPILDSLRPQFNTKKINVEAQFLEGNNRLYADPDKLSQVVSNLLQNAWQYTPPEGTFRIVMKSLPGEIKVVFANTAGELSEKDLPFIFERFYRGEKSRSREHGEAGIGLAIVKELIEAHNGHVGAEMSHDEIRIWFTLPLSGFETQPNLYPIFTFSSFYL